MNFTYRPFPWHSCRQLDLLRSRGLVANPAERSVGGIHMDKKFGAHNTSSGTGRGTQGILHFHDGTWIYDTLENNLNPTDDTRVDLKQAGCRRGGKLTAQSCIRAGMAGFEHRNTKSDTFHIWLH